MSTETPQFTAVIPTYNRAHVVQRAIRSALAQSIEDLEVVLVDDGSTDGTLDMIASDDPRLRVISQGNRGRGAARNRGIEAARGRYVAFLDSDDEALPNWLADFAEGFAQSTDVGIVCTGYTCCTDGRPDHDVLPRELGRFFGAPGQKGLFVARSFAVRRELLADCGGYAEDLTFSENTELALRLIPACFGAGLRIVSIDRPGTLYHRDRPMATRSSLERELASSEYILHHHEAALRRELPVYGYYLGTAGVRSARLGDYTRARRYFAMAARKHPRNWRHFCRLAIASLPGLRSRIWPRVQEQP